MLSLKTKRKTIKNENSQANDQICKTINTKAKSSLKSCSLICVGKPLPVYPGMWLIQLGIFHWKETDQERDP